MGVGTGFLPLHSRNQKKQIYLTIFGKWGYFFSGRHIVKGLQERESWLEFIVNLWSHLGTFISEGYLIGNKLCHEVQVCVLASQRVRCFFLVQ